MVTHYVFLRLLRAQVDILAAVISSLISLVCASVTFFHTLRHSADCRIENVQLL